MENAWDITTGSKGVIVADLEDGVSYNNDELLPNLYDNKKDDPSITTGNFPPVAGTDNDLDGFVNDAHGWNFADGTNDPSNSPSGPNGTAAAGLIGAAGDATNPIIGVNQNVSIMPFKIAMTTASTPTYDTNSLISGLNYIAMRKSQFGDNIAVVVMNLYQVADPVRFNDTPLIAAMKRVTDLGILIVSGAGDTSTGGINNDTAQTVFQAANNSNIILVAATDNQDNLWSQSNYGVGSVALAAPGVNIPVINLGSSGSTIVTAVESTTTFSADLVAGVLALEKAAAPGAPASQLKNALLMGTDPIIGLTGKVTSGGRLDALKAIQAVLGEVAPVGQTGNFTNSLIDGFAYDPDAVPNPIQAQLTVNGTVVATQTANGSAHNGYAFNFASTNDAHTGTGAAQINTNGGYMYQLLTGLQPNTTYQVTAWAQTTGKTTGTVLLRVNHDGILNDNPANFIPGSTFTRTGVTFTTGASTTTAMLILANVGDGTVNFDDVNLVANPLANPDFESGSTSWTLSAGSVVPNAPANSHSGNGVAEINTNGGTFTQTMTGLTPNTTYQLTAWAKSLDKTTGTVQVRVDHDATFDLNPAGFIPGPNYTQTAVTFTTGAATTAVITLTNIGDGTAFYDDLNLVAIPLANTGFESGATSWNFSATGASVVNDAGNAHSGSQAAKITTDGGYLYQPITGLSPNTTYQLTAYVKSSGKSTGTALLRVSHDGTLTDNTASFIPGSTYTQTTTTFTTGASTTTAMAILANMGNGTVYFDDLNLVATPLANSSFESGTVAWNFSATGASVVNDSSNSHSGSRAAKITTNGGYMYQPLTNLTPNTTYQLTAYVKSSGKSTGTALLRVSHDGTLSDNTASFIPGSTYTQTTVTFTTGASTTTAMVILANMGNGTVYFDDLNLATPVGNAGFESGAASWNFSATGASLVAQPAIMAAGPITVSIQAIDPVTGLPTTIKSGTLNIQNEVFVNHLFMDTLSRTPTTNEFDTDATLAQTGQWSQIVTTVTHTLEYATAFVDGLYVKILNRAAGVSDAGTVSTLANELVTGTGTQESIEAGFLASTEFFNLIGGPNPPTNTLWVKQLYQTLLERTATTAEVNTWLSYLTSHTRLQTATAFLALPEYRSDEVTAYIQNFLHRTPTASELSNYVNSGSDLLTIQRTILGSTEYVNRTSDSQRIAALAFTTPAQLMTGGNASGTMNVALLNPSLNPINAPVGGQIIYLNTTSAGGSFEDLSSNPITSVTVPSGSSFGSFKYLDSVIGTPTLTVSSQGIAQQQEVVVTPVATSLGLRTSSTTLTAGVTSPLITVTLRDQAGNPFLAPASGMTVALSTSSSAGIFRDAGDSTTISSVFIAAGTSSATFKYFDTKAGTANLIASTTGIVSATLAELVNAAALRKSSLPLHPKPYQPITPRAPYWPYWRTRLAMWPSRARVARLLT